MLKTAHVHTKIHKLVFVKMSNENYAKITAAACVILCVKNQKKKKKKRLWVRPSLKAKKKNQ